MSQRVKLQRAYQIELPAGTEPPREFLIFRAGVNKTRKGEFLFDEAAAAAVMAAYAEHGVDVMLDLEHLSLDQESNGYDPDARGWAKLELRNGELWAVNVTWTPDGAQRLAEKRQRYVSPVFDVEIESRRVVAIFNIAITALPATDEAPALVAASLTTKTTRQKMAAEVDTSLLYKALGVEDGDIAGLVVAIKAFAKTLDGEPGEEEKPKEEPPKEEDKPAPAPAMSEAQAVAASLYRLTGAASPTASLLQVETWRASFLQVEADRKKNADDLAALESTERNQIYGRLIASHVETADTIVDLAALSLPRLRARATSALERKALHDSVPGARSKPSVPTNNLGLTERELARCAEKKIDPAKYAATKAGIDARTIRNVAPSSAGG